MYLRSGGGVSGDARRDQALDAQAVQRLGLLPAVHLPDYACLGRSQIKGAGAVGNLGTEKLGATAPST